MKLELDASWKWDLACSVGLQSVMHAVLHHRTRQYVT